MLFLKGNIKSSAAGVGLFFPWGTVDLLFSSLPNYCKGRENEYRRPFRLVSPDKVRRLYLQKRMWIYPFPSFPTATTFIQKQSSPSTLLFDSGSFPILYITAKLHMKNEHQISPFSQLKLSNEFPLHLGENPVSSWWPERPVHATVCRQEWPHLSQLNADLLPGTTHLNPCFRSNGMFYW